MQLYSPVDWTGNVNMIEKLVLGGTWTGDLPIFSMTQKTLRHPDTPDKVNKKQTVRIIGSLTVARNLSPFWRSHATALYVSAWTLFRFSHLRLLMSLRFFNSLSKTEEEISQNIENK